jgi:hypothetical protein
MTKEFVIFLLVGRLIIWTLQNFPLAKLPSIGVLFGEDKGLAKLVECDFCLGFWVYFGLAFAFKINLLDFNVAVISEALTGLLAAFIMHIFMIGLKEKFSVLEIK